MTRQLIVCCDGTNNTLTGRHHDTNVARLCELLDPDANDQLLYYDPGVGNPGMLPSTNWADRISRRVRRLVALAWGRGIYENIAEGYSFLMQNYRPGDQIFLYGFSRGAFTARSIGGVVNLFGVLRPEMQVLIPTLLQVYFSDRSKDARHKKIAEQTRELFCAEGERDVPIWFTGVWDTVASVGAPLLSREITSTPTIAQKHFVHVRQALALDEQRRTFLPRPYAVEPPDRYAADQSLKQLWFPGSHCDVGGGYRRVDSSLSDRAFLWMVQESCAKGLRLRADLHAPGGSIDEKALWQLLQRRSENPADGMPTRVHSETYSMPYWALAGLCVRDTGEHLVGVEKNQRLDAPEQFTPPPMPPEFPRDTVWAQRRSIGPALLAFVAMVFFFVLCGALLATSDSLRTSSLAAFVSSVASSVHRALDANMALAQWQLLWWWGHGGATPYDVFEALDLRHVRAALWIDLGLIASYGYLLGLVVSRSFAMVARLRRVTDKPPRLLNLLGWSGCVVVVGDLAENALTYVWRQTAHNPLMPDLEYVAGAAMSLASAAKWAGLAGCIVLAGWALALRFTRR